MNFGNIAKAPVGMKGTTNLIPGVQVYLCHTYAQAIGLVRLFAPLRAVPTERCRCGMDWMDGMDAWRGPDGTVKNQGITGRALRYGRSG
jgi:hypothetical protein